MKVWELMAKLESEFSNDYEVVIEVPDKDLFNVRAESVTEGEGDDGERNCVISSGAL